MESAIPMCWNSSWRFANKGGYGQKNISGIKEIVIRANGLTVSGMHGNAVCISLKRKKRLVHIRVEIANHLSKNNEIQSILKNKMQSNIKKLKFIYTMNAR